MNGFGLLLLLPLVLLGNGLRSVIASTVFVSEGSFASFLSITVEATAAIMELLMGAVLVSLLVAPWLMRRIPTKHLAVWMCVLAGAAALGLAALFRFAPPVDMRVALVVVLFPMAGFALATLAPISQTWAGLGGPRWDKLLTGAWSVAMPLAFLVTPQLVRVVAPRNGLDIFFAGFALVVLLLIGAILLIGRYAEPETAEPEDAPSLISGPLMRAAFLALLMFEGLTFLTSLETVRSPLVPPLAALFAGSLWYLARTWRAEPRSTSPEDSDSRSRVIGLFAALFLLNVATTGFFDTAYLVRHSCSSTLIDDRATLAAFAQVIAATGTAMALARWSLHMPFIYAGIALAAVGLLSYLAYPGVLLLNFYPIPDNAIFLVSRVVTGFGSGMATTATIFAVSRLAGAKSGAQLFLAFTIIIGTEIGLEGFELLSQVFTLSSGGTLPPYALIFLLQAVFALLAILPLILCSAASAPSKPALAIRREESAGR
ncbi:hypothetical protein AYJ57_25055 (plasmid) [Salipiger sp. CCB-MM3]|uniref:hypothetical protein n=1 Tax=Salipiger sp. CCB-MM3 TaxID=1792508 RepID=UPI00080AB5B6|nr:hypothetical protein [Salipiger sp. CCB-MM3]ANT63744.1 hypothetical protein AYJ57_25055 [Salipiger sp. CCB-MM3]